MTRLTGLRPELPDAPVRIAMLPVHRGYPVPWFVSWLADDGETPLPRGEGTPDFRVLAPGAVADAIAGNRCWVCGGVLGVHVAFVIGPMCAVNRISAEPPSHVECAEWSARACPFLTRPHMERRENDLPSDAEEPAGTMIRRNPGVGLIWVTRKGSYRPFSVKPKGVLFNVGEPTRVVWITRGREATRDEVEESIRTGLPFLIERAEAQGSKAVRELTRMRERAERLYP